VDSLILKLQDSGRDETRALCLQRVHTPEEPVETGYLGLIKRRLGPD